MIRAVVLGKGLAKRARAAALKRVKLTDDDRSEIARLRESTQALKGKLDTTTAYASRKGVLLDGIKLNGAKSEPVVVLLKPKPWSGYGSLLQRAGDGSIVGGLTLQVEEHGR